MRPAFLHLKDGKVAVLERNITERTIKAALKDKSIHEIKEAGTPLRLQINEDRSGGWWGIRVPERGKTIRLMQYPVISVSVMREALPKFIVRYALNPNDDYKTVAELMEWYLKLRRRDKDTTEKNKRSVELQSHNYIVPMLGNANIAELNTRELMRDLIDPLSDRLSQQTILKTFSVLKAAAKMAVKLEVIESAPILGITQSTLGIKKAKARDGYLTINNVQELVRDLNCYPVTLEVTLLKVLLMFGTRFDEARLAKWSDFDAKKQEWRIPGCNTKSGNPITHPLTIESVQVIEEWRRVLFSVKGYTGIYLFPATVKIPYKEDKPKNDTSIHKVIKDISKGNWTAHHTRKCCADSWMQSGEDFLIVELVLNHSVNKVTKAYVQDELKIRRYQLLKRWHEYLKM